MANVVIPNSPLAVANEVSAGIWKLCLALIKAGWSYRASGDGTNKDTTANILNSKWGAPVAVGGQTGAAASITTQSGDDFLVTGVTGLVAPTPSNQGGSEGRFMQFSGAANAGNNAIARIVRVVSATSCWVRLYAGTGVANDANNGAISWTEKDPIAGVAYPTFGAGSWILLRGPSVLKIPITAVPAGTFLRGEKITQAGTGAEGEILGWTFDGVSTGWLVVLPRVTGTGAGRRGWDQNGTATYAITGASTGATVNPSGTIVEYVQETCFGQNTDANRPRYGNIYHQCVDVVGESASLFSTLAASAGCTAALMPGAGGTGNAFPATGSWVPSGTAGTGLGQVWWRSNFAPGNFSNCQIMVANAIEFTGQSADGSFCWSIGQLAGASGTSSNGGFAFQRVDDSEEGDLNPFVWWTASLAPTNNIDNRTRTTEPGAMDNDNLWRGGSFGRNDRGVCTGWQRRGYPTGDTFINYGGAALCYSPFNGTPGAMLSIRPTTEQEVVKHALNTVTVTEPIWLISGPTGFKCRKGTLRWIRALNGSLAFDTYDSKKWITLNTQGTGVYDTGLAIGPWDQTTAPVQ